MVDNTHKIKISLAVGGQKDVDKSFKDVEAVAKKTGVSISKVFDNFTKDGKQLVRTIELATSSLGKLNKARNAFKSPNSPSNRNVNVSKNVEKTQLEQERRLEKVQKDAFKRKSKVASDFLKGRVKLAKATLSEELSITKNGENSILSVRATFARRKLAIEGKQFKDLKKLTDSYLKNKINFNKYSSEISKTTKAANASLIQLSKTLNEGLNNNSKFKQNTTRQLQAVRNRIELEKKIIRSGADSIEAQRAIRDSKRVQAERILQAKLARIQNNLVRGKTTFPVADKKRLDLINKYETVLKRINSEERKNIRLKRTEVDVNKNLLRKIAEVVVGYRAVNSAINLGIRALKNVPVQGLESQATQAALEGIFGSVNAKAIRSEINDLALFSGQSIDVLEKGYRKFAASAKLAGLEQEVINQTFEDFTIVGTVLHKTSAEMDGIFVAIDQIFSKGVAQSEELKRQLGNQLPAAVEIGAKAMGLLPGEFFKAMKANQIIASEFVPKFAALYKKIFSGDQNEVLLNLQDQLFVAYTRTLNQYTIVTRQVFDQVDRIMVTALNAATAALKFLGDNFLTIVTTLELIASLLVTRLGVALIVTTVKTLNLAKANRILAASYVKTGKAANLSSAKQAVGNLSKLGVASGVASLKLKALSKVVIGFVPSMGLLVGAAAAATAVYVAFSTGLLKNERFIAINSDRVKKAREENIKLAKSGKLLATSLEATGKKGASFSSEYIKGLKEAIKANDELKEANKKQLFVLENGIETSKQITVTYKEQTVTITSLVKTVVGVLGVAFSAIGKFALESIKTILTVIRETLKRIGEIIKFTFNSTANFFKNLVAGAFSVKQTLTDIASGSILSLDELAKRSLENQQSVLKSINETLSGVKAPPVLGKIYDETFGKSFSEGFKKTLTAGNALLTALFDKAKRFDISAQLKKSGAKSLIEGVGDVEKAQKELADRTKARLKSNLTLIEKQSSALKRAYEEGKIPMREFFSEQERLIKTQIALQEEVLIKRKESLRSSNTNLPLGSSLRENNLEEIKSINLEIAALEADKASKLAANKAKRNEDQGNFIASLIDSKIRLAELNGELEKAARLSLEVSSNSPERVRLRTEENDGSVQAQAAILREQQLDKEIILSARLNEILEKRQVLEDELNNKLSQISADRSKGLISDTEEIIQTTQATSLYKEELEKVADAEVLRGIAAQTGNSQTLQSIQQIKQELNTIPSLADKVGEKIRSSLSDSLGNSFEKFVLGTENAKQAMKNLVTDILKQVARLAAIEAAKQLIGLVINLAGSAAGSTNSTTTGGQTVFSGDTVTTSGGAITSTDGAGNIFGNIFNSAKLAENFQPPPPTKTEPVPVVFPREGKKGFPAPSLSGGVIINQKISITVAEVEGESQDEQTERLGKLLREQMKSIVDKGISDSTRLGNQLNRTQVSAF